MLIGSIPVHIRNGRFGRSLLDIRPFVVLIIIALCVIADLRCAILVTSRCDGIIRIYCKGLRSGNSTAAPLTRALCCDLAAVDDETATCTDTGHVCTGCMDGAIVDGNSAVKTADTIAARCRDIATVDSKTTAYADTIAACTGCLDGATVDGNNSVGRTTNTLVARCCDLTAVDGKALFGINACSHGTCGRDLTAVDGDRALTPVDGGIGHTVFPDVSVQRTGTFGLTVDRQAAGFYFNSTGSVQCRAIREDETDRAVYSDVIADRNAASRDNIP